MTIWRMRVAGRMTKATDTHLEYISLTAFSRVQRLRERASMMRIYVHCLSCLKACPLKQIKRTEIT